MSCLLLSACVKDDRDDCDAEVRFYVTLNHSVQEFDTEIANDVYFQIYENDILYDTDIVPYETIQGGKDYVIRNYKSGTYRIVAWAVPANNPEVPEIPQVSLGESYHDVYIGMQRMPGSTTYYEPIGDIYLGETTVTLNREESSRHEISLEPCVCKVYFTLYRADLLMETRAEEMEVWVELEGSRSELMADRSCGGEESIIYKTLEYDTTPKTLISNAMGVLPSEEDQSLSVTVYKEGYKICRVDTSEKAVAGKTVRIEFTLQGDVVVYVDGWRVKDAHVTYFY